MNTKPLPETYAGAITELESIVRKMQSDDCDIDSLAAYTARSLQLLRKIGRASCRERVCQYV